MKTQRKTIRVDKLVEEINQKLCNSSCEPNIRIGMIIILEDILHATNNYYGYRYLVNNEVPSGQKPGVIHFDKGSKEETEFPDRSRRRYFLKEKR
jgi:hypothetical protein